MRSIQRISIILIALVLVGQGCLGGKGGGGTDGGVYKSTAAGTNWAQITAFPTAGGVGNIGTANVIEMTIDPSDQMAIYIGTANAGMLFSYDGGTSWQSPRAQVMKSGFIRSITVDAKDVCTIYVVNNNALYKTTDCSRSFARIYDESRSNVWPKQVAVDWFNPAIVFLGLSNGDVLKSTDAGVNWTKIVSVGRDITEMIVSKVDSRTVLIGTSGNAIYKTVDGGSSWVSLSEAMSRFKGGSNVKELFEDAAGNTLIASTNYGLLRSEDVGETWSAIKLVTAPGQVNIMAAALDPKNPNIIYYATPTTFYKTVDGGVSWDTSKLPTTRSASIMRIDKDNTSNIYMGVKTIEK